MHGSLTYKVILIANELSHITIQLFVLFHF